MNVQQAKASSVEITTSEDVGANDRRKKLLIEAQGGVVYLKFSSAAQDSNAPASDDYHLKLADGAHFLLEDYAGPCRAQSGASLNYTEFF